MKRLSIPIAALTLLCCLVQSAVADDIRPPEWRGLPGTTVGQWDEWTVNPNIPMPPCCSQHIAPDSWVGPAYSPLSFPFAHLFDNSDLSILDDYLGRTSVAVVPELGSLVFDLPNYKEDNPVKKFRMQVTWLPEDGQEVDVQLGSSDTGIEIGEGSWTRVAGPDANGWVTDLYSNFLFPNPTTETADLTFSVGSGHVDQVVIDTYCTVPEPATLINLLGLAIGGFVGLRFRRRRTR